MVRIEGFPTAGWTTRPDPEGQVSPARGGIAGKDCELFWSTRANQLRISECGLRNSKYVLYLSFVNFNPKSEISNPKCDDSPISR